MSPVVHTRATKEAITYRTATVSRTYVPNKERRSRGLVAALLPLALLLVMLLPITKASAARPDVSVDLDGEWAYQQGDNPQWADPSFDDSGWAHLGAPAFANVAAARWRNGIYWYRQRVPAPQVPDLALEIGPVDGPYEVYVNGKPIGGVGRFPPHPAWYASRTRVFSIPSEARDLSGYLLIAIRVYRWPAGMRWGWIRRPIRPYSVQPPSSIAR